jgi:hypothetical protein
MVGLDLVGYLGLVGSVCGMLQVEAYGHSPGFGYRVRSVSFGWFWLQG